MMSELTENSVITRSDGWMSAWVGDELVMMSAETGTCISLSETGGRTWELLEEPRTLRQLCSLLTEEYDAPEAAVRSDVLTFLTRLHGEGGVTVTDPAA